MGGGTALALCAGQSRPVPRCAGEGTFPSSARSWLPSPAQLNASTHSWLSDRVPSGWRAAGWHLSATRLALLLRERGYLPDLSVPSTLTNAMSACLALQSGQGQQGPASGVFACRARAS